MKASRWIKAGISVALAAGFIFFIVLWGSEILNALFPFFTGIIFSYVLLPLAECFERLKISRTLSILFSILLSLVIVILIFVWLIPVLLNNIKDLTRVLPELYHSVSSNITEFVERNAPDSMHSNIRHEIDRFFIGLQQVFLDSLHDFLSLLPRTLSVLVDILVGWILSFYILKDRELIIENLKHVFPEKYREGAVCFVRDIHKIVVRFIQGQIFIAFIVGIIETAGLYIAGIPYAPLLGFIGGISNVIPYFGPYIGAVPAVTIALTVSPWKAVLAAFVFVVAQQIDNLFLSPRILKEKLGLHPVTIIMSVTAGGRLFGFFGLVFAVPLAAVLKTVFQRLYRAISG